MNVTGHYIRTGQGDSAELRITPSMAVTDRYHVEGMAMWGESREFGPNIGVLEFSADLEGNTITHSDDEESGHEIVLIFHGDALIIKEKNWVGRYGMNVTFEGTYKRASALGGFLRSLKMAISKLAGR